MSNPPRPPSSHSSDSFYFSSFISGSSRDTISSHISSVTSTGESSVNLATRASSSGLAHDVSSPVLFCDKCKQILTNGCLVEGKHRNHSYSKLQDVVQKRIEGLESNLKHLKNKANKSVNIQQMVSRAKKQCENTYKNVKDVMTAQYSELHTLLDENQQQAFLLLKAERDSLKEGLIQLAEDADSYRQRFESIRKNIEELDRRQDSYNLVVLLAETEVQLLSLETINHFYSNVERRMKVDGMRMSTLEKSITKIVQKNKTLLPQPWEFSEAITFDPDKKHKDLTISEDKTQVSLRGSFTKQSKDCRAASANILASQSFSTGKHYWEVDVGGCQNWSVGVAENGWVKNGVGHTTLGRDNRSWLLESNEGNLTGVHHNDVSTISEASVQRLGVLVDCDMAKVNFYDALTGMKLHTLSMNFQSVVVPAFSIRHMGERKNSKLVICNLKSTGDYLGVMLTPRIHRQ